MNMIKYVLKEQLRKWKKWLQSIPKTPGEEQVLKALEKADQRKIMYLGNHKALATTIFGHIMFLDTRDISITPHIIARGFWELWITKAFLDIVQSGMTIVEVGANVGYYTLLAASRVGNQGKVYAFEADPNTFKNLFYTIDVNGFHDHVNLVNKAAYSKSNEKVKFYTLESYHGGNSLGRFSENYLRRRQEDQPKVIDVDTISLDDFFKDEDQLIDLIKIDAQGSEPHIFRGMAEIIAKNPDLKIVCEFEPECLYLMNEDPEKFIDNLLEQQFILMRIDPILGIIKTSKQEILQYDNCELFLHK